jgi:hypothetical protein
MGPRLLILALLVVQTTTANDSVHAYLPKIAPPGAPIVATVVDPDITGAVDAVVTIETSDGKLHSSTRRTDDDHHLSFVIPLRLGQVPVREVFLGTGFDERGLPSPGAARLTVGDTLTLPDTEAIETPPASGPAILRGRSNYECGWGRGLVDLQVRDVDPRDAELDIDGSTDNITLRGASPTSIEGELYPDTPLGRHVITIASHGATSNAMPIDIVAIIPQPFPAVKAGVEETLAYEVRGLGTDAATLEVHVSGTAQPSAGGDTVRVPIVKGYAHVPIRGVGDGNPIIWFRLHVTIDGYWS